MFSETKAARRRGPADEQSDAYDRVARATRRIRNDGKRSSPEMRTTSIVNSNAVGGEAEKEATDYEEREEEEEEEEDTDSGGDAAFVDGNEADVNASDNESALMERVWWLVKPPVVLKRAPAVSASRVQASTAGQQRDVPSGSCTTSREYRRTVTSVEPTKRDQPRRTSSYLTAISSISSIHSTTVDPAQEAQKP